jgi:hypothetical protein
MTKNGKITGGSGEGTCTNGEAGLRLAGQLGLPSQGLMPSKTKGTASAVPSSNDN